MKQIAQIITTHICPDNLQHVDVYHTSDGAEQGVTVAVLDLDTGKEIYFQNEYCAYDEVKATLKEMKADWESEKLKACQNFKFDDISSLRSARELAKNLSTYLGFLNDSYFLDTGFLADDCLSGFNKYDWRPLENLNLQESTLWSQLLYKGKTQNLNVSELDIFLNLTIPDCHHHPYFHRVKAKKAIASLQKIFLSEPGLSILEAEQRAKTAAVDLLYDTGKDGTNANALKTLSQVEIYDLITSGQNAEYTVDGKIYRLEPYISSISSEAETQLLEDTKESIESELLK